MTKPKQDPYVYRVILRRGADGVVRDVVIAHRVSKRTALRVYFEFRTFSLDHLPEEPAPSDSAKVYVHRQALEQKGIAGHWLGPIRITRGRGSGDPDQEGSLERARTRTRHGVE